MDRQDKILEIIADNLNITVDELKLDLNLKTDLKADSLDFITIVTELEEEYDFKFDDTKIETIITVKDLVDYINQA